MLMPIELRNWSLILLISYNYYEILWSTKPEVLVANFYKATFLIFTLSVWLAFFSLLILNMVLWISVRFSACSAHLKDSWSSASLRSNSKQSLLIFCRMDLSLASSRLVSSLFWRRLSMLSLSTLYRFSVSSMTFLMKSMLLFSSLIWLLRHKLVTFPRSCCRCFRTSACTSGAPLSTSGTFSGNIGISIGWS